MANRWLKGGPNFFSDSSETLCFQTLIQKRRANCDWLVEEMVEVVVVVVDDRVVLIRYLNTTFEFFFFDFLREEGFLDLLVEEKNIKKE